MRNLRKIKQHLGEKLIQDGIEVYHLNLTTNPGQESYLEVVLIRPSAPLTLEDIVYYTPLISNWIDEVDDDNEHYLLDIYSSQSGLPLFTLEHYQAVIGKSVTIEITGQQISGTLLAVANGKLEIQKKKETITINFDKVLTGITKEKN